MAVRDAWSHWTGPSVHNSYSIHCPQFAATDFAIAVKPVVNTTTRYCAPPWLALATAIEVTVALRPEVHARRRTVTFKNKTASPRPPIGGQREKRQALRLVAADLKLGDDLYAGKQPMCERVIDAGADFVFRVTQQTMQRRKTLFDYLAGIGTGRTRYRSKNPRDAGKPNKRVPLPVDPSQVAHQRRQ